MTFVLQPLDYPTDSLHPFLSKDLINGHYVRTQQYFDTANNLITRYQLPNLDLKDMIDYVSVRIIDGALLHNLCSAWNHQFYWNSLAPTNTTQPSAELLKEITIHFGSLNGLKNRFVDIGVNGIGSHWTWLVSNAGRLHIRNTPNSSPPILHDPARPLLVVDGWEHAYCAQYHENKRGYYEAMWQIINWEHVNDRFAG